MKIGNELSNGDLVFDWRQLKDKDYNVLCVIPLNRWTPWVIHRIIKERPISSKYYATLADAIKDFDEN